MEALNLVVSFRSTGNANEDIRNFFKIFDYATWVSYMITLKVILYRRSKSFEDLLRSFRTVDEDLQGVKQSVVSSAGRKQQVELGL